MASYWAFIAQVNQGQPDPGFPEGDLGTEASPADEVYPSSIEHSSQPIDYWETINRYFQLQVKHSQLNTHTHTY